MSNKPIWFATFRSCDGVNRIHLTKGPEDLIIQASPYGITRTVISNNGVLHRRVASDEGSMTVRNWILDFVKPALTDPVYRGINRMITDLYNFERADGAAYTVEY